MENIECNTYQLTFKTGKEVLSKPFLSWLKITASPFHSSALLVFVSVVRLFPVFNLIYSPPHFRKYSNAQLLRGCFAFQQPGRLEVPRFSEFAQRVTRRGLQRNYRG